MEVVIKEVYRTTTYAKITGASRDECYDKVYCYFKSNQYCWQVSRSFVDPKVGEDYHAWVKEQGDKLWWKHASGRDFD